jgi:hypothetical protein
MRTTSVAGVLAALGASFAIAADSDIETSANATRRVLFVANNGVDSISCGDWGSPCRSIGQAIDNAIDGDQIVVGPGRYGDLNSDGDFDDGGEERARQPGIESGCVICIGKRIHLASIAGAAATIVDGGNPEGDFPFIVFIPTSGVTFGEKDKGFTLKDGQAYGLKSNASKVRVAGNVALNNPAFGFQFEGSGNVASNISIGSTTGFDFEGNFTLTNNSAIGNNGPGFRIGGRSDIAFVVGNLARDNTSGFSLDAHQRLVVRANIATANIDGFHVDAPDLTFVRNAAIGNKLAGVYVGPRTIRDRSTIRSNNIFGNNDFNNCGMVNLYGNIVDAQNNFWGSPTGPGPDPADNAGPGCDMNGSSTITTPFATRPFAINW